MRRVTRPGRPSDKKIDRPRSNPTISRPTRRDRPRPRDHHRAIDRFPCSTGPAVDRDLRTPSWTPPDLRVRLLPDCVWGNACLRHHGSNLRTFENTAPRQEVQANLAGRLCSGLTRRSVSLQGQLCPTMPPFETAPRSWSADCRLRHPSASSWRMARWDTRRRLDFGKTGAVDRRWSGSRAQSAEINYSIAINSESNAPDLDHTSTVVRSVSALEDRERMP